MRLTTVALLLVLAACKRSGGEADLPPASGAGAAPLPQLPKLEPASAAGGTTVAATQDKATGELAAHERAEVGPTVSGILTTVSVREGDRVKKGDPLFKTDARDAWLRYQQAQAALEAATVNEQAVKTEYDRTKYLFEQNAANRAQWEQIQARYDGAKVAVRQAKVALSMAGKSVGDASVRSPIAGVVTKKLKNAGEMVTTMPPSPVVVVEQLDPIDLHVHLPERALARIKRGDKLTATFEAIGVTKEATVTRILPTVDPRSRTFEVIAEIPNAAAPDHPLTSGLLAT
ncbi:MAG TPA: efflux RND transporter periplasmic adaptor subunit, partial [Kofleriaceae bacterium]|nr:efflux RND transporter periplasmic adaptor subunit [Kofleriaceae bacterium]